MVCFIFNFLLRLQPRTEILLKALVSKEINTKDSLLEAWKEDQYCMYKLIY